MPFRKKFKRTYRRKPRHNIRRQPRWNRPMVNRSPRNFVSNRLVTKHVYGEYKALSLTTQGVIQNYLYRLNSVFDPDYTGVGTQPYGRDQLAALYGRYRVVAASVFVTFRNRGDPDNGVMVAIRPASNNTTPSTEKQLIEDRLSQYRIISGLSGSRTMTTLRGYYPMSRIFGKPSAVLRSDDLFSAAIGTNPSHVAYLNVSLVSLNANSSPAEFTIRIVYYTIWSEPLTVASS